MTYILKTVFFGLHTYTHTHTHIHESIYVPMYRLILGNWTNKTVEHLIIFQ
jgi:hypothetical protein